MKLLDNLEGITRDTIRKNPVSIVGEMVQQQQCTLEFVFREECRKDQGATLFSCDACIDDHSGTADGHIAFYGIAKIKDPKLGPKGRLIEISEEKSAGTKRAVRAQCAEQVLLRMYGPDGDRVYLQRAVEKAKMPPEAATEVGGGQPSSLISS